jgi:hypothetical protein
MNSIPRSTLIGLIGALLGYGLRAYRDPILPFFEITSIDDFSTPALPKLVRLLTLPVAGSADESQS